MNINSYRIKSVCFIFIFILTCLIPTSSAKILYVSSSALPDGTGESWETAFTTITAGLTFAASGDEIWVQSATYPESIDLREWVALYGGFAGTETNRDDRDWQYRTTVIDSSSLGQYVVKGVDDAILDGFTIQGASSYYGSGIYCYQCTPTVANCTITANTSAYGGGVCCIGSHPTLRNCIISGNSSDQFGGGVYCDYSFPTLIDCVITNNSSSQSGGGVYCQYSSPSLINCTIQENEAEWYGGGISVENNSSPTLSGCRIIGNTVNGTDTGGAGLLIYYSSPVLKDCTILGNIVEGYDVYGGGVCCAHSSPTLINCTISANSLNGYSGWKAQGGGVYSSLSTPVLTNCMITGNIAQQGSGIYFSDDEFPIMIVDYLKNTSEIFSSDTLSPVVTNSIFWNPGSEITDADDTSEPLITYSCIDGGWTGEGNIDSDPMFIRHWDGASADLRLRPGSPCIDAGTPIPELTTDQAGRTRPVDIPGVGIEGEGAYDIGAYERQVSDVGDVGGMSILKYSLLWQRDVVSASPTVNESEYQIYNMWDDDLIDVKDILILLDIERE